MSALREEFARADVEVVVIYMETCDGVDDHAAEMRNQITKHSLKYPVLDGEQGEISDPFAKRFSWAPRAMILGPEGVVRAVYPHMRALPRIKSDLHSVVALDIVPRVPGLGWRDTKSGAWIEVRIEGGPEPVIEKRTVKIVANDAVTLRVETRGVDGSVDREERRILAPEPRVDPRKIVHKRAGTTTMKVEGSELRCRIIDSKWQTAGATVEQRSWVALDPDLPNRLLRQETTERLTNGDMRRRIQRVLSSRRPIEIGDRKLDCCVVEERLASRAGTSCKTTWYSPKVPGHVAKTQWIRTTNGVETRSDAVVTDFASQRKR